MFIIDLYCLLKIKYIPNIGYFRHFYFMNKFVVLIGKPSLC